MDVIKILEEFHDDHCESIDDQIVKNEICNKVNNLIKQTKKEIE